MIPKKLITLVVLAVAFCMASCGNMNKSSDTASTEKNKEAMKKVFDAFESGKTDGLENYVAENMIEHTKDPSIKGTGLEGLKEAVTTYHAAFPDMKNTIYSMVADGDMVVAHFNMKGTNSGAMGGMPATNKPIDVNGVDIVRFENGKAVEHWSYSEEMKMMQQLGMMPDMNEMNKMNQANADNMKTRENQNSGEKK
jgi:steroid delta-isomerase-like uncharacterized protein